MLVWLSSLTGIHLKRNNRITSRVHNKNFFLFLLKGFQKVCSCGGRTEWAPVWPDAEIKSRQIFSKVAPKVATAIVTWKLMFSKKPRKTFIYLGNFCNNVRHRWLSKIAKSCHTGRGSLFAFNRFKRSPSFSSFDLNFFNEKDRKGVMHSRATILPPSSKPGRGKCL